MAQNVTEPTLTGPQLRAAVLSAEDELTDEQIAAACNVSRRTLARWRELPEFAAEVEAQKAAILAKALRLPVARKAHRLKVLNELHDKALAVIAARADEGLDAAGSDTGLIVRDVKAVGAGRDAEIVDVFAVDVALMREIRGIQEQAAKETGDWTDNLNVTGTAAVRLVGVDPEAI